MMVDHGMPGLTCSPDTTDLVKALIKAQAQFPAVEKGGDNKFGKYRYMRYSDICEALREPLNAAGLTIPQVMLTRINGEWVAVGTLRHSTGQFVTSLCPIYMGTDKDGNQRADMQSLGSAYTYAKKYLLLGLVGAWAEDDDDAQKAQPAPRAQQIVQKQAAAKRGADIERAAKAEIDKAADMASVGKTLALVKLRVSERVADQEVYDRVAAYAATKFGGA